MAKEKIMKLTKIIKKSIRIISLIMAINQGAMCVPKKIPSNDITVSEDKLSLYINTPLSFNVLDYLNLASSIVHNKTKGNVDCKDYVNNTYNVYMKLVNLYKRDDLRDKIRLAIGSCGNIGHVFIEFEDLNRFVPYETTNYTPPLSINEIQDYSTRTKSEKIRSVKTTLGRSIRGGKIFYPTLEAVYFPGGMARIVYEALTRQD